MNTDKTPPQVPLPFEEAFADRLRAMREALGLSQMQFAATLKEAGLSFNQSKIDRIERGVGALRLEDAAALAKHLGVPLDSMVTSGTEIADKVAASERALWQHSRRARDVVATAAELRKELEVDAPDVSTTVFVITQAVDEGVMTEARAVELRRAAHSIDDLHKQIYEGIAALSSSTEKALRQSMLESAVVKNWVRSK